MKLVSHGRRQPLTFATVGATGRIELYPSAFAIGIGARMLLDDRGCVWIHGSLAAELLPDGEVRSRTYSNAFAIEGRLRRVDGGFELGSGPESWHVSRAGIVTVAGRSGLRFEGYRPGLECPAALLLALMDASMPSMAEVDGVPPEPIPPPVGSRCRRRGPD